MHAMEMIFFNLSTYFLRCCTQNLCKEHYLGKLSCVKFIWHYFSPFVNIHSMKSLDQVSSSAQLNSTTQ